MEKPVHFFFVRSLQDLALSKATVALWNKENIRNRMIEGFFCKWESPCEKSRLRLAKIAFCKERTENNQKYNEIELEVKENVENLQVPSSVKASILLLVNPIGKQLFMWLDFHNQIRYPGIYLPNDLSWTPYNKIDREETAKKLVGDHDLNIITRYKLACEYCLSNDIYMLYRQLPDDWNDIRIWKRYWKYGPPFHCMLWTHYIEQEYDTDTDDVLDALVGDDSYYAFAFRSSAYNLEKGPTQYYLQMLTNTERRRMLIGVVKKVATVIRTFYQPKTDLLCALLSRMTVTEQRRTFRLHAFDIICCFFDWSYRDSLLEIILRLWDYLSVPKYVRLLEAIANEMCDVRQCFFYSKLFSEVWQVSPLEYKQYAVSQSDSLFKKMFRFNSNFKCLHMIFSDCDISVAEKNKLILSNQGISILIELIGKKDFNNLRFFIRECVRDENGILELRRKVLEEVGYQSLHWLSSNWSTTEHLFANFISEFTLKTTDKDETCCKKARMDNTM